MTGRGLRAILTYHAVDPSRSPICIDERTFRRHVAWLASGRVRVCALADLLTQPPETDAVALTFDDGFVSFAERAWPVLRDYGLSATVFVVSDHVGRTNAWGGRPARGIPSLPVMEWETLGRLAETGVELGAHTRSHRDLRRASPDELEEELTGCAERIAGETGHRPSSFAYPFGFVDTAAAAAAARVYARACTAVLRPLGPREDVYRLPRLDASYFRASGRLEQWGTPAFHRYLRVRAAARAVRAALSARGY
jgi:peptidoglycan/xylan/chitin deacetylase (PgdA/CDA1 family)